MIGQPVGTALKIPVVIENNASSFVAKSPPDGYTASGLQHRIARDCMADQQKTLLDVTRDIAPVTLIGANYSVLVVPASSPYRTVSNVIAATRTKAGSLSNWSQDIGGPQHTAGELFQVQRASRGLTFPMFVIRRSPM
nr:MULTISPECIES: tripartite tricarboxylate transporter substrate-binding protein [unclassified Acidovorax]